MTQAPEMEKAVEAAGYAAGLSSRLVGIVKSSADPELRDLALKTQDALLTMASAILGAAPSLSLSDAERARLHKAIEEFIYDRDGLAAWLTDRRNQSHSDGDTWSKGWHDANEETLSFVREVAFKRSSEATDAVLDADPIVAEQQTRKP